MITVRTDLIHSRIFHVRQCSWCRKKFMDEEQYYEVYSLSGLIFCEDCKSFLLVHPVDFSLEGSREIGTPSWKTAREYILWRDDCHCRVCDESWKRDNPVDVHHIIPRKDGGTNHPRNLVTLCEKHHQETFKNDYAGLKLLTLEIKNGKQSIFSKS